MLKAISALLIAVTLSCTETLAQYDEVYGLRESAYLSRLEFKNAEFLIKYWTYKTPDDPKLEAHSVEVNFSVHGLLDYENERCFWLQRREKSASKGDTVDPSISFVIFRDGKGLASPSTYKPELDVVAADFFKFTGNYGVWRVEYAGTGKDDMISDASPQKLCDDNIRFMNNLRDKRGTSNSVKRYGVTLPDGSRRFTIENITNKSVSTTLYDPRFVFPIRQTSTSRIDGVDKLESKLEASFELVDGFTRGKSITTEGPDFIPTNTHGSLAGKRVRTIEYKWLQFNEDRLEWPDEAKIMSSSKEMLKFITPEE